ncbi:hypothetical protein SteCoe_33808 [Stentor coeruleus]|uniref:Peptidase M14 domain-containing protein n=1 Tax=Stentor coeruleus TaxID=5963 RepID=A0A1R2AVX6_9CILI|nr:hypothetical protein SteCoe_33808 [Stentor coeruleus]
MFLACLLIVTYAFDWETALSQGDLEGFLTPSNVETFISNLNNDKIESVIVATTSQNNTVYAYVHKSKVSTSSYIIVSAGHTTLQPLSVTMSLYYFASILTATEGQDNYELYKFIRENFNLYVLPMINLDAYAYMETNNQLIKLVKNLRPGCNDTTKTGVNLNRNFGKEFSKEISDECSDYYQGTSSFSEPETAGIKSLVKNTDFILWVHYDGYGNEYIIPWTYDPEEINYGSASLNTSYNAINQTLQYNNVTIKTSDEIIRGSLIDYALSFASVTIQPAIGVENTTKDTILSVCHEHMGYANELLKIFAQNPILEYTQGTLSAPQLNSDNVTYSTEGSLNFTITNPSYSDISILLNVTLFNVNSTLFYNSTEDEELTIQIPIKIEKMETSVHIESFTVVHDIESIDSIKAAVNLYSESGYLRSEIIDIEVPFNDNNENINSVMLRAWYRSSGHHEGVAVGLVSALIATILALVILLLFCLYKKEPGTEEEESEPGFIHKEIHVAKNNDNQHMEIRQPAVKDPPKAQDSSSGSFKYEPKEEAQAKIQVKSPQPVKFHPQIPIAKNQFDNDDEPRIIAMNSEKNKFSIKEDDDDDLKPTPIVNIPNRGNLNIPKAVEVPEHHKPHFKEDYPQGAGYPVTVSKNIDPTSTAKVPQPVYKAPELPARKINEPQGEIIKVPPPVYKAPELPSRKFNEPQGEIIKVPSKAEIKEPKFISPPVITSKGRVEFKDSDSDSSGIEILHNPTNASRPATKIMMPQDFDEEFEVKKVTQPTPGQVFRPTPVEAYQGHLAVPLQGHKNEGSATFQPSPYKENQGIYSTAYKHANDSKSNSSKASKGSSSRKSSSSSSSSSH